MQWHLFDAIDMCRRRDANYVVDSWHDVNHMVELRAQTTLVGDLLRP